MSVFVVNTASELNLHGEYGFNTRTFSRYPCYRQSPNGYSSVLFLCYEDERVGASKLENCRLPKRIGPLYRNHYTLFSNDNSVCVVRTETMLQHTDNDAVLVYDVITPNSSVENDCMYTEYKKWRVSFDRNITYSDEMPNFSEYRLIGSGEWWFFDDGIILNGHFTYGSSDVIEQQCSTQFIYYELHDQTLVHKCNSATIAPLHSQILATQNARVPMEEHQPTAPPAPVDVDEEVTTVTEPVKNEYEPSAPPLPQHPTTVNIINNNMVESNIPRPPPVVTPTISVSSSTLPEGLMRILYQAPMSTTATNQFAFQRFQPPMWSPQHTYRLQPQQYRPPKPSPTAKCILPSLFWFDERDKELQKNNIEYFLPLTNTASVSIPDNWQPQSLMSQFQPTTVWKNLTMLRRQQLAQQQPQYQPQQPPLFQYST
jgi:hypothetical protein